MGGAPESRPHASSLPLHCILHIHPICTVQMNYPLLVKSLSDITICFIHVKPVTSQLLMIYLLIAFHVRVLLICFRLNYTKRLQFSHFSYFIICFFLSFFNPLSNVHRLFFCFIFFCNSLNNVFCTRQEISQGTSVEGIDVVRNFQIVTNKPFQPVKPTLD
jgi:hypothetical protein